MFKIVHVFLVLPLAPSNPSACNNSLFNLASQELILCISDKLTNQMQQFYKFVT